MLIVEDHDLLAQSLALALRAEGMEVVAADELTDEAILAAVSAFEPELVLLDLQLGEEIGTSIHLIQPITAAGAGVVMVTASTERVRLAECVEAGASAIASKSDRFEELVDLVRKLAKGGGVMDPHTRDELLRDLHEHRRSQQARLEPFERLTPREQFVLAGLMEGNSAEVIANDAVVSLATVRSQIRAVLMKLGVSSQLAAVALARSAGWTPEAE